MIENVPEGTSFNIDWEAFRIEAAKDILCAMVRGGYSQGRIQEQAKLAKRYADELIKLFRDGEE